MLRSDISFANGNRAATVHAQTTATGSEILHALDIPSCQSVLVVSGGASGISPDILPLVERLLVDGVAQAVAEDGIAVVDGGTQAGVMQAIGEGRARVGGVAPLIGVCPAARVSWPGGPAGASLRLLEPNHTHFVLTPGEHWGDETPFMFSLVETLCRSAPSLAILINGGSVAQQEVLWNIRQQRTVIVVQGSGRLADLVADVWLNKIPPLDAEIATIIQSGRMILFDSCREPGDLALLIRSRLAHQ